VQVLLRPHGEGPVTAAEPVARPGAVGTGTVHHRLHRPEPHIECGWGGRWRPDSSRLTVETRWRENSPETIAARAAASKRLPTSGTLAPDLLLVSVPYGAGAYNFTSQFFLVIPIGRAGRGPPLRRKIALVLSGAVLYS
jgi:hypothetical protein